MELDERRCKKWDVQQIREQRRIEKLKRRHCKDELRQSSSDQQSLQSFYPQPEAVQTICYVNELPVQAFGEIVPKLAAADFRLPWLADVASSQKWGESLCHSNTVAILSQATITATANSNSNSSTQQQQMQNSSFVFLKKRKRQQSSSHTTTSVGTARQRSVAAVVVNAVQTSTLISAVSPAANIISPAAATISTAEGDSNMSVVETGNSSQQ